MDVCFLIPLSRLQHLIISNPNVVLVWWPATCLTLTLFGRAIVCNYNRHNNNHISTHNNQIYLQPKFGSRDKQALGSQAVSPLCYSCLMDIREQMLWKLRMTFQTTVILHEIHLVGTSNSSEIGTNIILKLYAKYSDQLETPKDCKSIR